MTKPSRRNWVVLSRFYLKRFHMTGTEHSKFKKTLLSILNIHRHRRLEWGDRYQDVSELKTCGIRKLRKVRSEARSTFSSKLT